MVCGLDQLGLFPERIEKTDANQIGHTAGMCHLKNKQLGLEALFWSSLLFVGWLFSFFFVTPAVFRDYCWLYSSGITPCRLREPYGTVDIKLKLAAYETKTLLSLLHYLSFQAPSFYCFFVKKGKMVSARWYLGVRCCLA